MHVLLRPVVAKYIDRLSATDKNRIKLALKDLSRDPPEGDIQPLTGQSGYFRLRIGNFRALYRIENNVIFITNLDPRGQAYKKKNRGNK